MKPAFDLSLYAKRRDRLMELVQSPILLMGNGNRVSNLPSSILPFRQDSSFLYFTGCPLSEAWALLENGRFTLFLEGPHEGDVLWHGPEPSLEELGERYGADAVLPPSDLDNMVEKCSPKVLAIGDEGRNRRIADLMGKQLVFGVEHGDAGLVNAVIKLRRRKGPEELAEMRLAARHTQAAFVTVMKATHLGGHERNLNALFNAVLATRQCTTGFDTILTQRGEILHNMDHCHTLASGRLLLVDGGGECPSGYTADVSRTWPVNGVFSQRQQAAYEAVLAAQLAAIEMCHVGVEYRQVHDKASATIAQFLHDEGLLTISPEAAVEAGAHALFFPHGVGHFLGLDVHDLENFGDLPAYPPQCPRPAQFGTCYLRLNLPLEANWVVTIEPGFYVVPAILSDPVLHERFKGMVDFDKAAEWAGFGGIRIEDDIHITDDGPQVLTQGIPKQIPDLESLIGTEPFPDLLCH
ncbi:MAG: aminopeptidase P family protein [Proteobacteria bacterium]|nr:aminopeptidase P family protein [Pseudomonadota bacterium]